jgi:hypothetical protein
MQTMPQQEMQLENSATNCEAADDGAQQVLKQSYSIGFSSSLVHANNLE